MRAAAPEAARSLAAWGTELARWLLEPLVRLNFIDRSLALSAQAFSALIPLMIVIEAAQPGRQSLAQSLIARFQLTGAAADTVRAAFAPPTDEATTTVVGVLLLVVSVLSFTRRLQRLYEATWSLPQRGLRGTGAGLTWIAFFAIYISLHPALDRVLDGLVSAVCSLAGVFVLGLLTPYLLLARRVPWRRLLLQAALTSVGMTALGVWTVVYMPRAISGSADAYGAIGVAFALLTWLWGVGLVLVCAAVYGSPQMRWRPPARSAPDHPVRVIRHPPDRWSDGS